MAARLNDIHWLKAGIRHLCLICLDPLAIEVNDPDTTNALMNGLRQYTRNALLLLPAQPMYAHPNTRLHCLAENGFDSPLKNIYDRKVCRFILGRAHHLMPGPLLRSVPVFLPKSFRFAGTYRNPGVELRHGIFAEAICECL